VVFNSDSYVIINAYRNAQRIIHVPFFNPRNATSEAEQLVFEEKMASARSSAAAAIGHLIRMREPLVSERMRQYIGQHMLPFVSSHLPNVHFRVKKCYALVLATGNLVREIIICTYVIINF
jgi:hypothetical protein